MIILYCCFLTARLLLWHINYSIFIFCKKIQASIAQTLKRQTEALGKKRKRSRRNSRNADDLPVSNDNENMNDSDVGKDSSSVDERTETEPRTCNTFGEQESQFPQNSASTDPDGAGGENIQEVSIEISASSTPAWGTNAPQSHPRVGGKSPRSSRLASLVDHLGNSSGNDDEEVNHFSPGSDFLNTTGLQIIITTGF